MEIANFVFEIVKDLWGLASKPLGYISNLKHNVRSLDEANKDLKAVSDDVKARVEREEEGGGVRRTNQVANWLSKVQDFVAGVDQVLQEAGEPDRIKCLSRCLPRNCRSSYKLGKRVDQLLNETRHLHHEKDEFKDFTSPLPPPPVLELPMGEIVGLDIPLRKVLKWVVEEKQVRVIGLYGKGGVGKTTLMKMINEEFLHANHGFDIVIWVVVSRQVNEDSIRDALRKRLHIRDGSWGQWSQDERVHHLCDVLTRKKFVLLIDDVWRRLDLSSIGVRRHSLENGSKVVFTTRVKRVCDQMGADKTLEVELLTPEEALKLFEKNVGKSLVNCHQEIQDLARNIAKECKGLPLALITVGQAMAKKDNPFEWRHALTTLRNNPHKLSGMVEEVYHILEFSYNSLNDSTLQACFLYCCLFPEDYPIRTDGLIGLWIGEGLLGYTDDVYRMQDEGESILGDLKSACLLESEINLEGEQCVKMHDVIRDMAVWISRDHGQNENKLLVIENEEDISQEMISKWGEAEKISVWGKRIRNAIPTLPRCSQLKTLFVRENNMRLLPRGFFGSMKARLTVLDLSENISIRLFPKEICDLISLQYLNLSSTRIFELPREIKNLTRLRWLLLDNISYEILVPTGAVRSLPLNVFSQWVIAHAWGSAEVEEEVIVEEVGRMQHLTDLSIVVSKLSSALKIFESPNLQRSLRRARITSCKNLTRILIQATAVFPHLEELHLFKCPALAEMDINHGVGRAPNCSSCFPGLAEVNIRRCGLSDLSWLVHAPKLRKLHVEECGSMESIIGGEFAREELAAASRLFSRLEILELLNLPKLRSICDHTLVFPQGVAVRLRQCFDLRGLPWDWNSAKGRSFSVQGDKDWWAKFVWDPLAPVTFHWRDGSPGEGMTYGEAARKIKDEEFYQVKIGFLPSE